FFFSSRRRHTRCLSDWSSDVCSSDLTSGPVPATFGSAMQTSATAWWAPKSGNAANEYEDAYAVKPDSLRFAVADGASETSFAKQWAELLVGRFVLEPPTAAELPNWVTPLQMAWAGAQQGKATA